MAYAYYNQSWYPETPYPAPGNRKATVATGGCGVVSASMALENVLGQKMRPPDMAEYAIKKGARVTGGTDQRKLLKCLCADYPEMEMEETTSFSAMVAHLKQGGFAVTSTPGNRTGWTGILSNAAHIFCVAGIRSDGRCEVLDPGYYSGKYSKTGRKGKVTMSGNVALINQTNLSKETAGRPIYLLKKKAAPKEEDDMMTPDEFYALFKTAMDRYEKELDKKPASAWAKDEIAQGKEQGITDGTRPQALVTREEAIALAVRACGAAVEAAKKSDK